MIALDLADCNPPKGEILPNAEWLLAFGKDYISNCRGEVPSPDSPFLKGDIGGLAPRGVGAFN